MGYRTRSVLIKEKTGQLIGASKTAEVISKEFAVTDQGSKDMRVTVFSGETVVANGINFYLQTSDGYDLWTTVAASGGVIAANTKVEVDSVAEATNIFTEGSHGFEDGEAVVVSNSADFDPLKIYYVLYLTAGTFKLSTQTGGKAVNITADDTTIDVTSLQADVFLISSDDSDEIPLGVKARVVVDSGAGDSTDIMDIKVTQGV